MAFRRSRFFCIRCMRLFQTHLGLSWTRYDVISASAARLLVAAVGCSCCKVHGNSRGESVGDRPPQLIPATHLLRICGCQQNMSATVVVGKSSHEFFGIENSWFSSPGYRKSIPAFLGSPWRSLEKLCHYMLVTDWVYSPSQVHSADPSRSTRNGASATFRSPDHP